MEFGWDPNKERKNLRKHRVSFAEAGSVFGDPLAITVPDPDHSEKEQRHITIGTSNRRRLLMVSHADRDDGIRIISARQLTRAERQAYEEERQH